MMLYKRDRGERILECITDEVLHRLNPNGEDCFNCGGEGETHDCLDGHCEDAESGCDMCTRKCFECVSFAAQVAKAVRVEVLRSFDINLATAWAKRQGRWREEISDAEVLANIHAARSACDAFTLEERADSACWVEGLA